MSRGNLNFCSPLFPAEKIFSPFSRGENLLSPTPLAKRGGRLLLSVYVVCIRIVYMLRVCLLCICTVYVSYVCLYVYALCVYVFLRIVRMFIVYVYLSCVYVQIKRYMRMSYVYMYMLPARSGGVCVCVVCIPSPAEKRDRGGERSPPRKKRANFPVKVARMVSFFGKISSCSMCI